MKRLTLILVFFSSLAATAQKYDYPKVTPDAKIVLELVSNVPETEFYVDGKLMVTAERAKVMINDKEHVIEAKPKGYIRKKDYIQPPYFNKYASIRFTYLIEDKEKEAPVTQSTVVKPSEGVTTTPSGSSETSLSALSAMGYENKYALVIGNASYSDAPLRNPVNDAKLISEELSKLGFTVFRYTNSDKATMKDAIRKFGDVIMEKKGVALFYYAGHGLQSDGINYLVPVDAKIEREYEIDDECIKADMVLQMLEIVENPMNIIIMDACRNNPYSSRTRSLDRGLAQPRNAPKGSIIAFATAPGKTASDGDGNNGLYTQELVKALREPGLTVEQVFKQVRINVIQLSNEQQTPWENSSLLGDFYFRR